MHKLYIAGKILYTDKCCKADKEFREENHVSFVGKNLERQSYDQGHGYLQ